MNNFTVYTMEGCPYCEKVQELLREAGQKFDDITKSSIEKTKKLKYTK